MTKFKLLLMILVGFLFVFFLIGYLLKDPAVLYDVLVIPANNTEYFKRLETAGEYCAYSPIAQKEVAKYKVFAGEERLRFIEKYQDFVTQNNENKDDLIFTFRNGAFLFPLSIKTQEVKIYEQRNICNILKNHFAFFVMFILLSVILDIYNRKKKFIAAADLNNVLIISFLFIFTIIFFVCNQSPMLFHGDAGHYIPWSFENTVAHTLGTIRTPGYPLFIQFCRNISPISYYSVGWVQYGVYLLSLSWLIYILFTLKLSKYCCFALFLLFADFVLSLHFTIITESLTLSGIILLICLSHYLSICFLQRKKWGGALLLCAAIGIVVFISIMIKPYPMLIILAPLYQFFFLLIKRERFGKIIIFCLILSLFCFLPTLLFCCYRYQKCQSFNLCSLYGIVSLAEKITLADQNTLDNSPLSQDDRQIINEMIKNAKEDNRFIWPIDYQKENNQVLTTQVGILMGKAMSPPIFRKFSQAKMRIPFTIYFDNECLRLNAKFKDNIHNRINAVLGYYKYSWKNVFLNPRYNPMHSIFAKTYPFGKLSTLIWLLLPWGGCGLLVLLKVIWTKLLKVRKTPHDGECNRFFTCLHDVSSAKDLVFIAFFLLLITFSFVITLGLIGFHCEFRREMLALWGGYFAVWMLILFGWQWFISSLMRQLGSVALFKGAESEDLR